MMCGGLNRTKLTLVGKCKCLEMRLAGAYPEQLIAASLITKTQSAAAPESGARFHSPVKRPENPTQCPGGHIWPARKSTKSKKSANPAAHPGCSDSHDSRG